MSSEFVWGATKVWHCQICESRNVTTETDVFSDQCRNCTVYNELDWTEDGEVSVVEARAAVERMEAE
ncbi:hypothetical protein [Halorientalis halophila]|uniref:hypothetical protein n=1 Tax=Halorientalis halophila TaxID=3108499 RepID=UPI00300BE774